MQARTLRPGNAAVGDKCRGCNRIFAVGDRVIVHEFGHDAPWDLKRFAAHALCAAEVLARFKTTAGAADERAALAADFRRLKDDLLAGAVSLPVTRG